MIFADISSGTALFVDANIFVYAFGPEPQFGPSCGQLLERIELHDLQGVTSSQVLSDVAHRLMTLEACATFNWPYAGIAQRLKRHPAEIQQLTRFQQAIDAILAMGIQLLPVYHRHVSAAAMLSRQYGLLSNDALILAIMQENGLTHIASHDTDFDRVPDVFRYAPA